MSNRQAAKPLTIKEIAHEAGVSTQTVSRVLNNRPDVSRETRKKIQQIIDQLGYQPNAIARSLIRQRSYTLGLIASHLSFYGPQTLLVELDRQTTYQGYTLLPQLIHEAQPNNAQELKRLLSQQVDGIIWAVPDVTKNISPVHGETLTSSVPTISVGDPVPGSIQPAIIDERSGARLATEHLLAQGYKRIGLITGPLNWSGSVSRQLGWRDALTAADVPISERQVVEGDWSAASGQHNFYRLLEHMPDIDAVFACNDQMALGVLQAAHLLGRRVPHDLGVVGFDNFTESAYFWPPLTTVRQPWAEKCSIAVRELIRMIEEQKETGDFTPAETQILFPELLIRKSSMPD